MYCSGCGMPLFDADVFCTRCGRRVEGLSPNQTSSIATAPPPQVNKFQTSFRTRLKWYFGALCIVLVCMAPFIFFTYQAPPVPETNSQVTPPPKEDALTAKQHVAELRKLVSKKPLQQEDVPTVKGHITQLQLRKADADKTTAQLIAAANLRITWVEWRGKVANDALVACRNATKSQVKASDPVDWHGESSGWDPDKDWHYNVDIGMNLFGKYHTVFACQAVCSEKRFENGMHCMAERVSER